MGYVIFALVLLLILACAVAFTQNKEALSSKTKLIFTLSALLLIALITLYNILQSKQSEEISRLRSAFFQGKPLTCDFESQTHTITNETFNFSNGTMSFLGKPNTIFNHLIIPLEYCFLPIDDELLQPHSQD